MSIAGHLDALCIDTECCEYFSEFLGGQRCLEALTKQLLGPRTFVPCMLRDERLDLFLARRTKQIPDKKETSWPWPYSFMTSASTWAVGTSPAAP